MKRCFILLLISIFWSCNDPETASPISNKPDVSLDGQTLAWVLNEGNFGSGIATTSKIVVSNNQMSGTTDEFFNQNQNFLGNVAQSMYRIGEEYWIVVNNSQKIVITDLNFKLKKEIKGFNSPRYLVFDSKKVWVSDLYQNSFYQVDIGSKTIEKEIRTNSWNEELFLDSEEIWIPQTKDNKVLIYSILNERFVDTIQVSDEPFSIQRFDENTNLVLCNGFLSDDGDSKLHWVDKLTRKVVKTENLSQKIGKTSKMVIFNKRILLLSNHLYEYKNSGFEKLIDAGSHNFYGFNVSKSYIFLSDAKDYVSRGTLLRYQYSDSKLLDSTQVGVIPGFIFPLE